MGLGKIFARRDYPLDAITPAAGDADPACDAAHLLHEDGDERHEPEGSAIRHGTLGHQDDALLLHPHDLGGGAGRDGALRHLSAGGTTEFTTFGVVNLEKDRENYQGRLFKRWRERPFYADSEPSGRFQRPFGK